MQKQLPLRPCRIEYGKYLSKDYVPEKVLLSIRLELLPRKTKIPILHTLFKPA